MIQDIKGIADLAVVERGIVDALFKRAVEAVAVDMERRPSVETAREIVLTMRATPKAGESGVLVEVRLEFELKTKVPVSRTREISAVVTEGKAIRYNDLSPGDVRQGTLDMEDERNGGK